MSVCDNLSETQCAMYIVQISEGAQFIFDAAQSHPVYGMIW